MARLACAALGLFCLARLARRPLRPERAILYASAVALLLSPTFHPWYATWVAPWLALNSATATGAAARAAHHALTALVALAAAQYVLLERWIARGVWEAPVWLWPLMFAAPLVLLLVAGVRARLR